MNNQRSFIQPSNPATIQEGSSEYGSEYGSEYESEYESEDEAQGGAASVKDGQPESSSEYESDSDVEVEERGGEKGQAIGLALYDWAASEAGQCSLVLGMKYRVTHDAKSLLAAGWIGVVPVATKGAVEERGGLVPRSYIQLPGSYQEGSVSAAAAAAALVAEGGVAAAVEDDTTSEYETDTETEEEDSSETETEGEAEEVNEEDEIHEDCIQMSGDEEGTRPGSSSQGYESEYETTESESQSEADREDNELNATASSPHGVEKDEELDSIREVMIHIYQQHNPRKIDDVDRLLGEWQGEERLLLAKIRAKYGATSTQ